MVCGHFFCPAFCSLFPNAVAPTLLLRLMLPLVFWATYLASKDHTKVGIVSFIRISEKVIVTLNAYLYQGKD